MSTNTSRDLRCPRCDAHVGPGSQWCALCYCDLRPGEPATIAGPPAIAGPPVAAPSRGKHARPATSATAAIPESTPTAGAVVPDEQVDRMLAALVAAESGVPLGRFAGQLDSPGRRTTVMIGGGLLATGLVFLLMALVGVLL